VLAASPVVWTCDSRQKKKKKKRSRQEEQEEEEEAGTSRLGRTTSSLVGQQ